MKIEFHGGAGEVGRSCIEIFSKNGDRFLLDVGVKFKENGLQFPDKVFDIGEIDGVFLSHAHLDHSGGLPLFEHHDLKGPIFCTPVTFEISKILFKDSYKIARIRHLHPAYENEDLREVEKDTRFVDFDKWYDYRKMRFKFINAGHVPGSAMILLEIDGKRILYTGDFNNRESLLMKKFEPDDDLKFHKLDVLITESTYGDKELPKRENLVEDFIKSVKDTVSKGGSVLIPVFAVGRAQEVLIMLAKEKWKVPIYYDGMCKKVTNKILTTKCGYLNNENILHDMFFKNIEWIGSERHRKNAIRKGGIFVATSGMVQGGPIQHYIKEFWHDEKSKVMLMGYQCKNTNGRHLLDDGFIYIDGWKTYVKCKVEKYDFSGHTDAQGIKDLVLELKPDNVFFQHGDPVALQNLKTWAEKETSSKIYAPNVGDFYEL